MRLWFSVADVGVPGPTLTAERASASNVSRNGRGASSVALGKPRPGNQRANPIGALCPEVAGAAGTYAVDRSRRRHRGAAG